MFPQNTPSLAPARGRILLSEPFLFDPNFKRTVVLLCEHNEQGTFGFVLNRRLEIGIADVLQLDTILDIPLFHGGPVQNDTLHFLHCEPELIQDSFEIAEEIYWGGNFEAVKQKIEGNELDRENFRFFLGYSGWGTGQLQAEIDAKSWIVAEGSSSIVFEEDNEKMWHSILHNMGGAYRLLSNAPESPQMN